jgi:Fe-S-cluster-containing hydrogenase component 2
MKTLYIDPDKCSGCRTCEIVCSLKNENRVRPDAARIKVISYKYQGLRVPITCQQCEDPACMAVCPVKALEKDLESGIVRHNKDKCIGCRACIAVCPFGGISFNSESKQVFKCEQCNGEPQCVRFCLDKAITYVDPADVSTKRKMKLAKEVLHVLEGVAHAHNE